jgi:subtilase family serine protease
MTLGLLCACAVLAPATSAARVSGPLGPAPASQRLSIVLPLVADTAGLERFATAVSTPGSPAYGRYAPLSKLSRWFGASARARAKVTRFLRVSGATGISVDATGLFADATMTVARAERAFGTELARFRGEGGTRFVAPIGASAASAVPPALAGVAGGVVGLDTRPVVSDATAHAAIAGVPSSGAHTGAAAGCAAGQSAGISQDGPSGFTPNQYLAAYDFDPLHAAGVNGQGETVALIEIDGYRARDIDAFAQCFGLGVPELDPYGVGSISRPLEPGGESTLDLEVLDAAAPGLKRIEIFEANSTAADTLRAMTAPLELSGSKQPQVISASLGLCESDVIGTIGAAGLNNVEASLAAASATGITYLASSGDDGSADCVDQSGNPVHHLAVNYPASSWWVTGVGGTNFTLNAANQITSQVVWNDNSVQPGSAGGGGPSERFGRPSYQNGATKSKGRVVPDVSMLADIIPGYSIYCTAGPPDCDPSSAWLTVGGTSAATPLLAGGFALVDQELHAAGRANLGLVNPLLYRLGESAARSTVFDDVTVGDNDVFLPGGLRGGALSCCAAGVGFDDASGWGSVNVAAFEQQAVAAQPPIMHITMSVKGAQSAIRARAIKATVSCSSACLLGAYAMVRIGHGSAVEQDSRVLSQKAAGSTTVTIPLSNKELRKLKAGRKAHHPLSATVYGVLFNTTVYDVIRAAGESIQSQTAGKKVKLS